MWGIPQKTWSLVADALTISEERDHKSIILQISNSKYKSIKVSKNPINYVLNADCQSSWKHHDTTIMDSTEKKAPVARPVKVTKIFVII